MRPNKHRDPKLSKYRASKVLKIELPDFEFRRRAEMEQVGWSHLIHDIQIHFLQYLMTELLKGVCRLFFQVRAKFSKDPEGGERMMVKKRAFCLKKNTL